MRKFIIKDTASNTELVLPVTPPAFEVSHGINVETINIHALGDVILPGYSTLAVIRLDCMFPAKKYPFNQPKTQLDPYGYIKKFETWSDNHTILRFIVSGTAVNIQVIVSDISYGERDGSGDVYATINLHEYRLIGKDSRSTEKTAAAVQDYVIKAGDTLGAICRKYYGNASLYQRLATYNDIKNPNLIYAGKTIRLPDKSLL